MREVDGSTKQIAEAKQKMEDARTAYLFVHSDTGRKIMARIEREVTALLNDIAGGEPLDHETYVNKQNRIAALRGLLNGIVTDAANKHKWEEVYEQRAREYATRLSAAS